MAKIYCGMVVSEGEASTPYESRLRAARWRRMEMRWFRFGGTEGTENEEKCQKQFQRETLEISVSRDCDNTFNNTSESGNGFQLYCNDESTAIYCDWRIGMACISNPRMERLICRECAERERWSEMAGMKRLICSYDGAKRELLLKKMKEREC